MAEGLGALSAKEPRRWPRSVYGVGEDPDPRFSFANERTFLAWIRTGLGFLTAGVALSALSALDPTRGWEIHLASGLLVICGVLAGVIALRRWWRNERAMRLNAPLPSTAGLMLLTGGLILVGVVALLFLLG